MIGLQNNADVLVHTEAFDKYNKSLVRCAISTKIMDYLSVGRCILAIGPRDISSIEYLSDNDLALIARSQQELHTIISNLKEYPDSIAEYAQKGRSYVTQFLNEEKIRTEFYEYLQSIIDKYNNNSIV